MDKMKVAVIGMGNMGSQYAEMIAGGKVEGLRLAAVTRMRNEVRERLNQVLPPELPVYPSAEDLYEAVRQKELELDAVMIATPHYAHRDQAVMALKLGLHVLCDKPAGVYSRQAREINEAASEEKLVYSMIFHQRTNAVYRKMKELVESGRYGAVKRVNWVVTDWYRPDFYYKSGSWRATWKGDGGGTLLNQCPHNLDLLQWICGMPKRVQAFCHNGKYHEIEVEDEVTAYLEFDGGATGVFFASTGEAPGINRLEISLEDALLVCDKGALKVCELGFHEPDYRRTATECFKKLNGEWHTIDCGGENPQQLGILQNFSDAVLKGESLIVDGKEGILSLFLSNAIYLSSWEKRMVTIPVEGSREEREFEEAFERRLAEAVAESNVK